MLTTTERALTHLKGFARFALNEGGTLPALWFVLGRSFEWRERYARAAAAYARALVAADHSSNRRMFSVRQRWQYRMELARASTGSSRVCDPLFACRSTPDRSSAVTAKQRRSAPGYFEARWGAYGLLISGFLAPSRRHEKKIRLLLDNNLLREISLAKLPWVPAVFQLNLQRQTIASFPVDSVLRLETLDGEPLLLDGCARDLLHIPHGTGAIAALGCAVDKKGFLTASGDPLSMRQEKFLETYARAREVFASELGMPLMLLYGTLLGVHRAGDLIPGDDDFDVAYVSRLTTAKDIKQEAMQMVIQLVAAGFTVSVNRVGRMFRLRLPASPPDAHLDVHTIWREERTTWIHPQARLGCDLDEFLPASTGNLRGVAVDLPRNPEVFLSAYYGPGWKTPDPSYSTSARPHPRWAQRHFARTHLTPIDFASMQREIAAIAAQGKPVGRLISIGSYSLYPLEDYEQNCGP